MKSDNSSKNTNKMVQEANKNKQWCMIIDIEKCENCNNCFLACKDEYYGNDWTGYATSQPLHGQRWMNILKKERGEFPYIRVAYLPKPCFHCDDAPCINCDDTNIISGEIYKRDDGIVIIDPERAKGNKDILKRCPHGAIWWNQEKQVAQKCTLCAHLLDDGWKAPRCVQACPTGALTFHSIEANDFDNFIESNKLQAFDTDGVLEGDAKIKRHSVLYKNLDLYNRCFIAGSVATKKYVNEENREILTEDCVKNASVELYQNNSLIANTTTDAFGDYWFDGLPENSGVYEIKITHTVHGRKQCGSEKDESVEVTLGKSCFAGITWI